jgi:hypothetical protein
MITIDWSKVSGSISMTSRNAPKVISGDKNQTRRVEACLRSVNEFESCERVDTGHGIYFIFRRGTDEVEFNPNHQHGDILYVRESIYVDHVNYQWGDGNSLSEKPDGIDDCVYYRADGECCKQIPECQCATEGKPRWRTSRFMPKWAARTFIEITDVRCERIQDIKVQDIKAEGIKFDCTCSVMISGLPVRSPKHQCVCNFSEGAYRHNFSCLWDETNGKGSWEQNDWVFAYTFKLVDWENN